MSPMLIALCFVLVQPAPIAPDAASYQARKQLFDALDVYAENPTPDQAAVCGDLINQMIDQLPEPALRYYLDGARAAELVGRTDQATTILQTAAAHHRVHDAFLEIGRVEQLPVKYLYPSRTALLRKLTVTLTAVWGALLILVFFVYPEHHAPYVYASLVYVVYYFGVSIYFTISDG